MKFLGKLLFGLVVMFVGLQVFQISQQSAFTDSISYYADKSILEDDDTFFKSIFPFHYKEDLINERVVVDEVSFNLKAYLVGSKETSSIVFVLDNYSADPRPEILDLIVTSTHNETEFQLVSLGKENWYLQWVHLDRLYTDQLLIEDILDIKIVDDETTLYDYDETQGLFVSANQAFMQSYIVKQNVAMSHVSSLMPITEVTLEMPVSEKGDVREITQSFSVQFVLEEDEKLPEEDVYIIGNFNNYDVEDETYKLTKQKNGTFTGSFDIETDDTTLYYQVIVGNQIMTNEAGEVLTLKRAYVDSNTDLESLDIIEVTPISLSKYNGRIWRNIIIYLVIVGVAMWLIFFRKSFKNKTAKSVASQPAKIIPSENKEFYRENLNLKAIHTVEQRDEDHQVYDIEPKDTNVNEHLEIEDVEVEETNEPKSKTDE